MKINPKYLLSVFCFVLSLSLMAQTTAPKTSKPVARKTTVSKSQKTAAALAAREKGQKDSAEAVHALARKLALEYIAADSVKKAHQAEETRIKQEKYEELSRKSDLANMSKKDRKKAEKEEKVAEEKRKKELKEEEKAAAKAEKSAGKGSSSKSGKEPQKMQTYAILPFEVRIEKNLQMKKTTPEMLQQQEQRESLQYQNGAFQFLMKRKKDYAVNFQDIDDTNALLSRAGVSGESLRSKTKGEVCALLKVDGIVNGKFYRKEAMDQTVGKALNIVSRDVGGIGPIKSGDADLSLTLYKVEQQQITWTYKNDDWNGMKDQDEITERLMEKAAKKFPFKKK